MTIYEKIRLLRESKGMSQEELALSMGYKSRSAINKIEAGIRDINQSQVAAFAKALNTTPGYLMGWGEDNTPSNVSPANNLRPIPIYGTIPAGEPAFADQYITGYEYMDVDDPDEYFFLRVKGESMIGLRIQDGDLVLIKKQNSAEEGQVVAVLVNGDEATLKTYKLATNGVWLVPANTMFAPIFVPEEQIKKDPHFFRILGVLKKLVVSF